jgi:hypothetical protein
MQMDIYRIWPNAISVRLTDQTKIIEITVPISELRIPPKKPGFWEQLDIDLGLKKPPNASPVREIDRHSLREIKAAVLGYLKSAIEQEIRRL